MAKKQTLRDAVRKWMASRVEAGENPVAMLVPALAAKFNTTEVAMRAMLQSMASETGRGMHKLNANHYEYRPVERTRKPMDSQVRNRVYAYMMKQAPNTLHANSVVAKEVNALAASVNAALRWMDSRDFIPVAKESRGLYRRLPGSAPELDDAPYDEPAITPQEMREFQQEHEQDERARLAPSPAEVAAVSALRRTASRQDEFDSSEDDESFVPPGVLSMLQQAAADQDDAVQMSPKVTELATRYDWAADKITLRRVADTASGTILAEDEAGALYELTLLRPAR